MKLKRSILTIALLSLGTTIGFAAQANTTPIKTIEYKIINNTGAVIPYFYTIDSKGVMPSSISTSLKEGTNNFTFTVPTAYGYQFQSNIELVATLSASTNENSVSINTAVNGTNASVNVAQAYGTLTSQSSVNVAGSTNYFTVVIAKK